MKGSIDLRAWEPGNPRRRDRRLNQPGALPLKPGDLAVISAKAPLAEVTRYAAQLGSITQGQGSYTMEFSHYDMVHRNEQDRIVKSAKVAADEDE